MPRSHKMNLRLTRNEKLAAIGIGAILIVPKLAGYAAQQSASAAVNAASGAVTGTITTIGQQVGIPQTNMTQCQLDTMAGRTWDASFSCPAADFLRYVTNGTIPGVAGLNGLGASPVPNWGTLALLGGVVYLMMKKKGR